jgi:uncharacterized membrane protein YgcG
LLGRITSTSPSAAPSADHVVGASMDMDVQLSTRTSTTPKVRHSHRAMLTYFIFIDPACPPPACIATFHTSQWSAGAFVGGLGGTFTWLWPRRALHAWANSILSSSSNRGSGSSSGGLGSSSSSSGGGDAFAAVVLVAHATGASGRARGRTAVSCAAA